jgi:hypothetical protein
VIVSSRDVTNPFFWDSFSGQPIGKTLLRTCYIKIVTAKLVMIPSGYVKIAIENGYL